jgi:hypothetical protein
MNPAYSLNEDDSFDSSDDFAAKPIKRTVRTTKAAVDSDSEDLKGTMRQVNISRHINSVVNHFTASKEGYERLVNQLDDMLLVLDAREVGFKILFASGVSNKMISKTPDELLNVKMSQILNPDDVGFVLAEFVEATKDRRDANVFCRMKQGNGNILMEVKARPFSSTRSPIASRDCTEPVQFFVASCREYRNKASQSVDAILELSIEHVRLCKQLEAALIVKGIDPSTHALLKDTDKEPLNAEIVESVVDQDDRRKKTKTEIFCRQCGTTTSPEWRKGPDGPKTYVDVSFKGLHFD